MPRPLPLLLLAALLAFTPAPAPLVRAAPAEPRAAAATPDTLAPGVVARQWSDPEGPWAVTAVEVIRGACGVDVRSVKAGDGLLGRESVRDLAARLSTGTARPALAAVNADFFLFDPPGIPTGLQVQAGQIVSPPSARPVFAVLEDGSFFIGSARLRAGIRARSGETVSLDAVNRPAADGLALLDAFVANTLGPAGPGVVWIRPLDTPSVTGDTVRGVVVTVDTPAAPSAGATVRLARPGARGGDPVRLVPGDTVRWWTALDGPPSPVREAVGGMPVLVRDGRNIAGQADLAPAFRDRRHPRTAVGWTAADALILAVVDGRQPGHSEGMSLPELADLMVRLGAVEALNLDGGGSTTLVLRGRVANRPSDPRGERAVANALVVLGPGPGHSDCPRR